MLDALPAHTQRETPDICVKRFDQSTHV